MISNIKDSPQKRISVEISDFSPISVSKYICI